MGTTPVIVFVKAPRPGHVKTRLAAAVGDEAACAIYRELVTTLIGNLVEIEDVVLCHAPAEAAPEIRPWLRSGWRLLAQGSGDLGERLDRAFQTAFREGARQVVVIGSDCPAVIATDLSAAQAALGSHDLVLGPATDGGYWLIGLRAPQPALFSNLAWSTDRVLAETMERARSLQLQVHRLRELGDVDTVEDWERWQRTRTGNGPGHGPAGFGGPARKCS